MSTTVESPRVRTRKNNFSVPINVMANTARKDKFGIDFYNNPKEDLFYRISMGHGTNKEALKNFADIQAKKKQFIPGPKYVQHADWRDNHKFNIGRFLKKPRDTFTDDVMKFEKTKPAFGRYEADDKNRKASNQRKITGNYLLKDNRTHAFDHTKWLTAQYPPAKYNNTNLKHTKPTVFAAKIMKPEQPKMPTSWAIQKDKSPGPGSYDTATAMRETQWGKVKG